MATVNGNSTINIDFWQTISYAISQTQKLDVPFVLKSVFNVSGILADQCTKLYCPTGGLTFVASTPQVLNLQSLTDVTGAALSFAGIRFLAIRNNATTDGWVLLVGAAATIAWEALVSTGGTITVHPSTSVNSGFSMHQLPGTTAGVVDSTHKSLQLDPGGHAFTADILIAGF